MFSFDNDMRSLEGASLRVAVEALQEGAASAKYQIVCAPSSSLETRSKQECTLMASRIPSRVEKDIPSPWMSRRYGGRRR